MNDSNTFRWQLIERCREVLGQGANRLVFWGYNADCIAVLSELVKSGMPLDSITAVIDERPEIAGREIFGQRVRQPDAITGLEVDALVVTTDAGKELALRAFAKLDERTPKVVLAGMAHLDYSDPGFDDLILSCLVKSYATGYPNSLIHLYQAIRYVAGKGLKGDVAEFGICKGGTVVFLKKALEMYGLGASKVFGFDIFGGFPKAKTVLDLYRHPKCEFRDHETVIDYCKRFGIDVVKGDICDTYKILEGKPLILSFFDTDNYSPARSALELCATQTVPGGVIAFDHYTTTPDYLYTIGERMAANEFLGPDDFFNPHGTGLFIKS